MRGREIIWNNDDKHVHNIISHYSMDLWYFRYIGKGGGSFSIEKFMFQILGTLNRALWAWNWYKRVISGFRVCFFNNFIEKNQNETHCEGGMCLCMHFILSGPQTSMHICNHIRFGIIYHYLIIKTISDNLFSCPSSSIPTYLTEWMS